MFRDSQHLDPGFLDDRPPFLDLCLLQRGKRLRILLLARENLLAHIGKALARSGEGERARGVAIGQAFHYDTRNNGIVDASLRHGAVRFSDHILANGPDVFAHACRLGAEGIVSKRLGSPYRSGPCSTWIKVRNPASIAVQRERSEKWNR